MNPIDPIRPYLWLAKWIGLGAIVAVLFVGGCQHGKSTQAVDDKAALDASQVQVSALAGRLQTIDAETQAQVQQAAEQVRAAKAAEARASEGQAAYQGQLEALTSDIAKAKRDPDCKRMMEAKTCALLR